MTWIKREPAVFWGGLTAIIEATLAVLLIFGVVNWSEQQIGAVMALIAAIGTSFAFVVRSKVSPV